MFGYTYAVYKGQRSTLGINPWALSILSFLCFLLYAKLACQRATGTSLPLHPFLQPPPLPALEFQVHVTSPDFFTWVLGIQLCPPYFVRTSPTRVKGLLSPCLWYYDYIVGMALKHKVEITFLLCKCHHYYYSNIHTFFLSL